MYLNVPYLALNIQGNQLSKPLTVWGWGGVATENRLILCVPASALNKIDLWRLKGVYPMYVNPSIF